MSQSRSLLYQSSALTSDTIPLLWQTSGDDWQSSWTVSHTIQLVWQSS